MKTVFIKLFCMLLALSVVVCAAIGCTEGDNTPDEDNGQNAPGDDGGEVDPDTNDTQPGNPFENGYNPDGWV